MALAPWQRRKLREAQQKKAALHQSNRINPTVNTTDAQYQVALESDQSRLKSIASHAKRDELKATELLPRYREYLEGVLASGQGGQNNVLVQNMIWAIDCGPDQFDWVYQLADYAILHGMVTPDNFKRDPLNVLLGQIADWCIQQLKVGNNPEPHATRAFEYMAGQDVVDQIQAQLHRCMAEKYKSESADKALEYAETAYELDNKVGVMPLINALRKQLIANKQAGATTV